MILEALFLLVNLTMDLEIEIDSSLILTIQLNAAVAKARSLLAFISMTLKSAPYRSNRFTTQAPNPDNNKTTLVCGESGERME